MPPNRIPLYLRIRADLRSAIAEGRLAVGDRLPSEPELAIRHRTTRNTVRHAVSRLVFEGLVERRIGSGTYVAEGARHESTIDTRLRQSFEEQMEARGTQVRHRLLSFAPLPCPPAMAALLGIAEGAEVFQLRRLRLVGEEIVGYERRTMLADIARRIPATALEGETAIAMVEAALGARLSDLEVTVLAETASAELAQLLACRRGAALLVRRHVFRDPGGRIVLAGESCYRGDRYRFTYHLGRNGMAGRFSGEASDA